jgi:hypothetical protein
MSDEKGFQRIYDAFKDQLLSFVSNIYESTNSIILAIVKEKIKEESSIDLFMKFRHEDSKNDSWKKDWAKTRSIILKKDEKYFLDNNSFFEIFIPKDFSTQEKATVMKTVDTIKDIWRNLSDDEKELTWKYFNEFIEIYDIYDGARYTTKS